MVMQFDPVSTAADLSESLRQLRMATDALGKALDRNAGADELHMLIEQCKAWRVMVKADRRVLEAIRQELEGLRDED